MLQEFPVDESIAIIQRYFKTQILIKVWKAVKEFITSHTPKSFCFNLNYKSVKKVQQTKQTEPYYQHLNKFYDSCNYLLVITAHTWLPHVSMYTRDHSFI